MAADLADTRLLLEVPAEPTVLDGELPDDFLIKFHVAAQPLFLSSESRDFAVAVSNSALPLFLMGDRTGE
jgi:hypothetical protein